MSDVIRKSNLQQCSAKLIAHFIYRLRCLKIIHTKKRIKINN